MLKILSYGAIFQLSPFVNLEILLAGRLSLTGFVVAAIQEWSPTFCRSPSRATQGADSTQAVAPGDGLIDPYSSKAGHISLSTTEFIKQVRYAQIPPTRRWRNRR